MENALISDLQRYSVHDGPGIRTTVFLMGCNLRCKWCHNPECIPHHPSLRYIQSKCIACNKCIQTCKYGALSVIDGEMHYNRRMCAQCFCCVSVCAANALSAVGKEYTADQLFCELEREKPFFTQSNGGVTFSGGEPALHGSFIRAVAEKLKRADIHTAVETSGYAAWEHYAQFQGAIDLFLYDIKTANPDKHKDGTGADLKLIIDNLKKLDANGADIFIRMPIIPGFNDSHQDMVHFINLMHTLRHPYPVELLAYHNMAYGKYKQLFLSGNHYLYEEPGRELVNRLEHSLRNSGIQIVSSHAWTEL
jgi:pyruvate formate lyase activating enzyme